MKRIILKVGEEDRILRGHPWVYDNEVARILKVGAGAVPAELEPGELADVESSRKEYLGRAMVNPHSKIIARIYSPSKEGVDKGFFKRRIREAISRREGWDLSRESARLVFGEADFLPGLIIDRFVGWPLEDASTAAASTGAATLADASTAAATPAAVEAALGPPSSWAAVQFLTYGMDLRREEILAALEEVLAAPLGPGGRVLGALAGIIEKSAAPVREFEGLPLREGPIRGSFPAGGILLFENGLPFTVNLEEGQKTGHFLDQRENRLLAARYLAAGAAPLAAVSTGTATPADASTTAATTGTATPADATTAAVVEAPDAEAPVAVEAPADRERRVLDGCAYTGGFGIHAARIGAEQGLSVRVIAADSSAAALENLKRNARLNGLEDRVTTVEADIFNLLRSYERSRERFDLIILDPPAFAKTRAALEGALRGYKEINLRAIKLLVPGGILVTCSCSQALDEGRFKRMVAEAAADAERRLVQLDFRGQARDHPILLGYEESDYLKCGFYRAL
ncbi:MAG: class I SAM-dependent rRNA methyltransferase [Treponema sp.]|nr:class I SAM-dependent rRNA methyltransferase [Treponema sp.]